jgi:hypothetical protein
LTDAQDWLGKRWLTILTLAMVVATFGLVLVEVLPAR